MVLILVDDMGYSDIGCYGGEILTPNIDELASKGVRFTNTSRFCSTRYPDVVNKQVKEWDCWVHANFVLPKC